MENKCTVCGETLLFGKADQRIPWCPKCEGVEIISSEVSINDLRNEIKEINSKINDLIVNFDKERLLISLYITREGLLYDKILHSSFFMSYTELIKKIIDTDFNGKIICDPMSDEFQTLLRYAEKFSESKITLRLILNGWGICIRVRRDQMFAYCYDLEKTIKVENIKDNFKGKEPCVTWKFYYEWGVILENLEENGIFPKNIKLEQDLKPFQQKQKLNEFWHSIRLKILLEMAAGDSKVLEVDTLENVVKKDIIVFLRVMDELTKNFPVQLHAVHTGTSRRFSTKPVDLSDFLHPFIEAGLSLEQLMEFFVSMPFKQRCLGGVLLTRRGLFVWPQTLRIVSSFLKGKYYRNYLDGNHEIGGEFEDYVADKLEQSGLNIRDPQDLKKVLRNIKDDEHNPTLEIDILAYSEDTLFVIDCKTMIFSTDFIIHTRKQFIEGQLAKEIAKQQRRVKFISNHMSNFHLDPNRYKRIKNIIVTYNKEPIDQFGGIHIICVRDVESLLNL